MPGDYPALHRLENTIQPLTANLAGPFYMTVIGTVNTVGGGTGGTSSTDESTFTTGATSLTPIGALNLGIGAQATASMNSGQIGAPRMSGQRILFTSIATPSGGDVMDNANTAVRVNVVAGGAGGGVANITVRGTANTDLKVGYGSLGVLGAWPNSDGAAWMPVFFPSGFYPTVNAAIANAGIFGSVSVTGSVNITGSLNPVGIFGSLGAGSLNVLAGQAGAPWSITGSINPVGVFGSLGANMFVTGSGNTPYRVGYASQNLGAWPNYDGAAWTPVFFPSGFYPTVNAAIANAGIFGSVQVVGSVNITGSLNPVGVFGSFTGIATVNMGSVPTVWYGGLGADTANSAIRVNVVAGGAGGGIANLTVVGTANTAFHVGVASANISPAYGQMPNFDGAAWMPTFFPSGYYPTVNAAIANAGIFGSVSVVGSVNITGSLNPVGVFGSMSVVGSVNTTPLGVQVADVRGSLVPTQWIISGAASGQFVVSGSAPAAMRDYLTSFHLVSTGTVDFQWMSPSGVAISGSMRLLPGAGFALGGMLGAGPNLIGVAQGAIYINSAGTQNIGGVAIGWVGA